MNQDAILLPVVTLVGWTLTVLLLVPYKRFKAVFSGQVTLDDFKFGESARVPPEVCLSNRHFKNLLEVPLLFYVLCITLYVAQRVDAWAVYLAWGYVGLRILHSLVHLTYNRVSHRLAVYAASNLMLLVIWVRVLVPMTQ